jgi:hypothetical protein
VLGGHQAGGAVTFLLVLSCFVLPYATRHVAGRMLRAVGRAAPPSPQPQYMPGRALASPARFGQIWAEQIWAMSYPLDRY